MMKREYIVYFAQSLFNHCKKCPRVLTYQTFRINHGLQFSLSLSLSLSLLSYFFMAYMVYNMSFSKKQNFTTTFLIVNQVSSTARVIPITLGIILRGVQLIPTRAYFQASCEVTISCTFIKSYFGYGSKKILLKKDIYTFQKQLYGR